MGLFWDISRFSECYGQHRRPVGRSTGYAAHLISAIIRVNGRKETVYRNSSPDTFCLDCFELGEAVLISWPAVVVFDLTSP